MHQLASASENNIRQYLIVTNLSEQQHVFCEDKYCFLYKADLTTFMSKSTKQCLTLNQINSTELACNDYYAAILVCCRQGRIYVANEYPIFARTMSMVGQKLTFSRQITLNVRQNLSVLMKNMQILG